MGLWNRLKRLFGFGSDTDAQPAEPEAGEETATPESGVCAICGTDVDPGTEACPLCGSTDIAFGDDAGEADEDGEGEPAPKTTRAASDDDAVAKLKQLRQQDEE
ncbi:hypothetical protein [Natronomonas sp. EA1]|uniref:hypothetical protein n=1 Tax=Natronomonas sp. EA1 TaxID=3421655 RepID=UPI003EBE9DE4